MISSGSAGWQHDSGGVSSLGQDFPPWGHVLLSQAQSQNSPKTAGENLPRFRKMEQDIELERSREAIWSDLFNVHRSGSGGPERARDLPQVTQQVRDRNRWQYLPWQCSTIPMLLNFFQVWHSAILMNKHDSSVHYASSNVLSTIEDGRKRPTPLWSECLCPPPPQIPMLKPIPPVWWH